MSDEDKNYLNTLLELARPMEIDPYWSSSLKQAYERCNEGRLEYANVSIEVFKLRQTRLKINSQFSDYLKKYRLSEDEYREEKKLHDIKNEEIEKRIEFLETRASDLKNYLKLCEEEISLIKRKDEIGFKKFQALREQSKQEDSEE